MSDIPLTQIEEWKDKAARCDAAVTAIETYFRIAPKVSNIVRNLHQILTEKLK